MKLFIINTVSESGDHYCYFIKHSKVPTDDELKSFLIQYSNDKSNGTLYENIIKIKEIKEENVFTIPKLSKKELNKWETI